MIHDAATGLAIALCALLNLVPSVAHAQECTRAVSVVRGSTVACDGVLVSLSQLRAVEAAKVEADRAKVEAAHVAVLDAIEIARLKELLASERTYSGACNASLDDCRSKAAASRAWWTHPLVIVPATVAVTLGIVYVARRPR